MIVNQSYCERDCAPPLTVSNQANDACIDTPTPGDCILQAGFDRTVDPNVFRYQIAPGWTYSESQKKCFTEQTSLIPSFTMKMTQSDKVNSPKLFRVSLMTSHPVDATESDLKQQVKIWQQTSTNTDIPTPIELESFEKIAKVTRRVSGDRLIEVEIEIIQEDSFEFNIRVLVQGLLYRVNMNGSPGSQAYPDQANVYEVSHVATYFSFSKKLESAISGATKQVQIFGGILGIFIHPLVMLLLSINFLQVLSVLPVSLPLKLRGLILPFSQFTSADQLSSILSDPLYNAEMAYSAEFRAVNKQFRDQFIYARQRGFNFLLRLVVNLIMFTVMRKGKLEIFKVTSKAGSNKLTFKFWFNVLFKLHVNMNELTLLTEFLHMVMNFQTLESPGLSKFTLARAVNFLVISVDIGMMFGFQLKMFILRKRLTNTATQVNGILDKKCLAQVVSIYTLQDAGSLRIPHQMIRNYRLIFTLLLSALFQRYGIVFSVLLALQSSIQLYFDIKNLIRKRPPGTADIYNERSFILIELLCFFESAVFLLVGIMGFSSSREAGAWFISLLILLLTWMTLSLVQSFF